MFRWFETRIDAFPDDPPARPPETLLAFYVYFIKPVWPVFAVLLVAGFLGSLIEVSLLAFVGSLVDMMKAAETPEAFLANHWGILLWMAFVAMVARPIVSTAHDLIKNQIIAGPVSNRVRWHDAPLRAAPEPELLPERLRRPGRQQDHAGGAGAARFRGAADRRHLVRGRAVGRRGGDLRRRRLAPAAAADRVARRLHGRAALLRAAHQGALDGGRRGALHAGRAHRRQLHQHPHRQAVRPRRSRGRLRPRRARRPDDQVPGVAAPADVDGAGALHAQRLPDRVRHRARHLAVGRGPHHGRRHRRRHRPRHAHHRHVGLDPVGGRRHLREHRRGAGGHGDHQPPEPGGRPAGQPAAGGARGRDPLRRRELPLRPHGGGGRRQAGRRSSTTSRC